MDLVEQRIESILLDWCEQFIDLFSDNMMLISPTSILDIGCQAGQFYKSLRARELTSLVNYTGVDIEELYLQIGRRKYSEITGSFHHLDFLECDPSDWVQDLSVNSATLEHIDEWKVFVANQLEATKKMAIIRTFLGDETRRDLCLASGARDPYPVWQFSIEEFIIHLRSLGWTCVLHRDRFTSSQPFSLFYDNMPSGIARRIIVCCCYPTT